MIRVMLEEQARLNAGEGTTVSSLGLLLALKNPDRGYALKLVLGRQMDQLEKMLAGIKGDITTFGFADNVENIGDGGSGDRAF
jgi:hypothetical protein